MASLDFGCFADHLEEHLLHEVGFLDSEHFFEELGGCGPCEVFEEVLAVLQHEPQKVNVVVHFEQEFHGLFLFAFFEDFDDMFPLFDKHEVGVVRLKLLLGCFLRGQTTLGVFLLLKALEFFKIG